MPPPAERVARETRLPRQPLPEYAAPRRRNFWICQRDGDHPVVVVDPPDSHHRGGSFKQVQHHLLRRARLQPRRSRNRLRPSLRSDRNLRCARQGRPQIRGQTDRSPLLAAARIQERRSRSGVAPLAAIPTTTSRRKTPARRRSLAPFAAESSAPSTAWRRARAPPAITACTMAGGVPNVGGHSAASSTASLPLVPAPT